MADWELAKLPLNLRLAADTRAGRTSDNDQCWDVALAREPEEPALALQTRYGGRVGLARLVPTLAIDGKTIYEKGAFAGEYTLTALAPDFLRLQAEPLAGVTLHFLAWTIASDTLGGMVTLKNTHDAAITADVGMYFQAMRGDSVLRMRLLELATPDGASVALAMQPLEGFNPVLLLEGAQETGAAKLSAPLELEPGQEVSVRFVHAALADENSSLLTAYAWLHDTDWRAYLDASRARRDRLPEIETGDDELDAAILFSQLAVLRGIIDGKPAMVRSPASISGRDAPALDLYQFTSSLAVIEPKLAQGIIQNYLKRQNADGWIDDPNGELLLPMLAQLTEIITRYSADDDFLPGLVKFFERWLDSDDPPRWSSVTQANAPYHPTFSMTARGAIPADITLADCPDLFSYLLNEGRVLSLLSGKNLSQTLESRLDGLSDLLRDMWNADSGGFFYRDRDAKTPLMGQELFTGRGDQSLGESLALNAPNRVILQVEGGASHRPRLQARIIGLDAAGNSAEEVIENEQFKWYRGAGVATTHHLWSKIGSVQLTGLSRVYGYTVRTVDLSRHDISLMLPLTVGVLDDHQMAAMLHQLQSDYLRDYGLASLPHTDPDYHHPDSNGRHVSPVWNTMLGLALLNLGEEQASAEAFDRVAGAQVKALKEQGAFFQWYNAEDGGGLGTPGYAAGVISLHWLLQLIGVYVRDAGTVEILGPFAFSRAVKITWHGVRLARTKSGLKIKFASGHTLEFGPDVEAQIVRDPDYRAKTDSIIEPEPPANLPDQKKRLKGRIKIPVSRDIAPDDEGLWAAPD